MSVAVLLAGCATPPPQVLTPKLLPRKFVEQIAASTSLWPQAGWWGQFGSVELSALIAEAQADNRDLAVAAARVMEARAEVTIRRSAFFPVVKGQVAANRVGVGRTALSSSAPRGATINSFGLNVGATYELDVWGLARDNLRAAEEALKSSRFAQQAVRLSMMAAVADKYFDALALREQIAIAEEDIAAIKGILDVIKVKVSAGTASNLDLEQEKAQIQSAQATVPVLEQQELEARTALAVLVGRPPESFHVGAGSLEDIRLPAVAAGTPSQLLLRRPDVAHAEANLAAAHADLQAARAAFLPQFSLSGTSGYSSTALDALVQGPSFLWEAGAQLVQTIFEGGKLIGRRNVAYATQRELIASYQNAVLNAYADVENALGQVKNDAQERGHLQREVSAAREAFRISQLQYKEGAADLLNVLQAQQTLFGARDQLARVQLARAQAVIRLYEALGGGWKEKPSDRTQFARSAAAGP